MAEKITLQNLNGLLGRMQRAVGDSGAPVSEDESMAEKITLQNLNGLLGRMQRAVGDPGGPVWTRDASGSNTARVGALMLEQGSKNNGIGWKFVQVANESGGQRTLIRGSTARELWDAAQAWLDGFDAAAAQFRKG